MIISMASLRFGAFLALIQKKLIKVTETNEIAEIFQQSKTLQIHNQNITFDFSNISSILNFKFASND